MKKARWIGLFGFFVLFIASTANAMSLDWTGHYRAEWNEVDKPSLGTPADRKSYGLQFLALSPKIIATDGININSRFDIVNYKNPSYANSQVGDFWGFNSSESAVVSKNQGPSALSVSQLYLTLNQEYGSLMIGRMPLEFGMGLLFNSGKGAFDHWYNTRDLIAYKVLVGDWFITPMIGRLQSQDFGQGNTISTTALHFQYENDDNKSLLGFMMEQKKGVPSVLDYSASQIQAYGGAAASASMNETTTSFVFGRGFDAFDFKIEADFLQGETGIKTAGGDDVRLNGYGLATEFNFPQPQSKMDWSVKAGLATGDDPNASGYGGFAFDRNYDVAMLMFNHRLGKKDFLQTNVIKNSTVLSTANSVDDENISNAIYLAPSVKYAWGDKLDLRNTLIYGQLMETQQNAIDAQKDLGIEWNIELLYKPSERIQWLNQFALLLPGSAWKNGTDPATGNLNNDMTLGFVSKAAISF